MRLTRFSTVRGRLLALLIAIALPIGCVTALAAATAYRTITGAIETAQIRAADEFAIRTRIWYRGALRSLLSFGTATAEAGLSPELCREAGLKMLAQVRGFSAVLVRGADGQLCTAALDAGIDAQTLDRTATRLRDLPAVAPWSGIDLGKSHYDQATIGNRRYLTVHTENPTASGAGLREALLLIETEVLENVFDLGEGGTDMDVALVSQGSGVVASRGDGEALGWLPRDARLPQALERWRAPSRQGDERVYVARMVAEPDFYVVASFDDSREQAARIQFAVLLLAPLLTLTLLCIVYLRAIDRHCVRWLRSIEAAARSRATARRAARAAVADDMPSDIRSVAEAFNVMVDEQEVRQRRLQTALDDNRFLVRELHHRVKNSLQVVQSYIGLTKRDYRDEARLALADAECRVHVLSAAYRFTLADGEMQPVRVDLFLEDVVTMISNLIRRRDQWISGRIETAATLSVDRIIPLGFLVADVASRVLRSTPGVRITLTVHDLDDTTIEVAIEADREIMHQEPPRLFAGLLAQIEAVQSGPPEGRNLGRWRVSHKG